MKKRCDFDKALKTKALKILAALRLRYPGAKCGLHFQNPFQLLIATILSAQTTDVQVNKVTRELFSLFPDPAALAKAPLSKIEAVIKSIGIYKNKARNIKAAAAMMVEDFNSTVPQTMEELTALPGVGRKTANVVLGNAFAIKLGVVVDTHVLRVTERLGLTGDDPGTINRHANRRPPNPVTVERRLMELFPRSSWCELSHLLIAHGRTLCQARHPDCPPCPLKKWCVYFQRVVLPAE